MALYDRIAGLPLVIDELAFEIAVGADHAAVRAQDDDGRPARRSGEAGVRLVGSGEDVTYDPERAQVTPARLDRSRGLLDDRLALEAPRRRGPVP